MSNTRMQLFYSQARLNFNFMFVIFLLQYSNASTREILAKPLKKVVGGTAAPRGRFPYMCSLRRRGSREHVCGGTLIKSRWVLTAAHCVESQYAGKSPILYCGIYERDEHNPSKVFAADRTYVHLQWNGNISEGHDIALIRLDRTSDAPLPDMVTQGSLHTSGNVFSALGWGFNSSGSFTDLLQIVDHLPFVSTRICNTEDYWDNQIMDSMICAGIGEQDTQQGDSGGPLLQLDFPNGDYTLGVASYDLLVGITSFGEETDESFKPGVYTSISYFREWIDCILDEKENCSNDGQGTTQSALVEAESNSTSSITDSIGQDLQPLPALEASSSVPQTFGEASEMSPETLAESSEEATQNLEALLDLCPDIMSQRESDAHRPLRKTLGAIRKDDSETVQFYLCNGLNPQRKFSISRIKSKWTLLHDAAMYDSIKSARVLIDLGANIEKPNGYRRRPLHVAARYNSIKVAKLLIKSGANIEPVVDGVLQPLHRAAWYKSFGVAKLLLDSGADTDGRSLWGHTPLHVAAMINALEVAKLLLREGADVESRNDRNETPIHRAAGSNAYGVAKLLIGAGANVSSVDKSGDTPLHNAARLGALDTAEILVGTGADVNATSNVGRTPLHKATSYNRSDFAKFLVKNGASTNEMDADGNTPLHDAVELGYLPIAKILVDGGAVVDAKNNEGLTPLHFAASRNRFDVAKFLVENGASKKETNDDGNTPFDVICTRRLCSPEDYEKLQRLLRV